MQKLDSTTDAEYVI